MDNNLYMLSLNHVNAVSLHILGDDLYLISQQSHKYYKNKTKNEEDLICMVDGNTAGPKLHPNGPS